ncbi:type II secretion system F family protein [Candidatus Daviesbacteria bacterium]|nr:type II secretion system F family protein [Candidatus Daviesbacteria bacterium]
MAEYTYKAKDLKGVEHIGEIKASDQHMAALVLRKRGLVVITLSSGKTSTLGFLDQFFNKVSFTELVVMTRQLATMVSSGLVLSQAIDILEEQQTNKRLKKILGEMSQDIKGGLSLAQSMGKFPEVFPHLYINLIKSGETSGKLDKVLMQMADGLEKDREFKARIKGALIYPVIVISMMVVVMIIMMVFVIPRLTNLYEQSEMELPLPTKILIGVSNLFLNYWWLMIAIVIGGVIGINRWSKTPDGQVRLDSLKLKIPVAGKIIAYSILTNFNRTFGLLVSAGIPLLEAIGIVTEQIDNSVYKTSLKNAYKGVERGLAFSSLLQDNVFPRLIPQMIKVGEETGKVDEIFFKLADYFESETDHLVKNLTVAIEPVVLVILGIGVGFVVMSIILPIYKLTTSF